MLSSKYLIEEGSDNMRCTAIAVEENRAISGQDTPATNQALEQELCVLVVGGPKISKGKFPFSDPLYEDCEFSV